MDNTGLLQQRLNNIEKQLEKVRGASPLSDGWQTQRLARKQRKWDELAKERMILLEEIERSNYACNSCGALEEIECVCSENNDE